eukprot:CAMPEP_0206221376 /NCGR_PEP_ID=MMETSP0047_2-20121206/5381_1 /ASSEMBLY_ACC=CAM_ASM_000192 /TAXON_ID=195065 /ORGANISM="Chroomonas mesostigmatica_cf, Strain CCMP1168" /LENGTH=104 /DNA_ID=CAMNT_0053644105 /DNA_START=133 /DNA_END=447 /DNA_ORIENTATION=+
MPSVLNECGLRGILVLRRILELHVRRAVRACAYCRILPQVWLKAATVLRARQIKPLMLAILVPDEQVGVQQGLLVRLHLSKFSVTNGREVRGKPCVPALIHLVT